LLSIARFLPPLLLAAVSSPLIAFAIARAEVSRGIVCRDVHKPYDVRVPCFAGPALAVAIVAGLGAMYSLGLIGLGRFLAISLSLAIAVVIGLVDDVRGLSARAKIGLGLLPAIPVLALHQFVPRPWIPFFGHARMYLVYPLLVLAAYTVFCNGANMIDTHNGLLVGGSLSIVGASLALAIALRAPLSYVETLAVAICALAPYAVLNIYPARIFNGNSGSFVIGALLATCAITCRMESLYVLGNMVLFVNGLLYLVSVRGFLQKEHVKRPTTVEPSGEMKPSCDPRAPLTLVRVALALLGGADERRLVRAILIAYLTNAAAAAALVAAMGYRP